MKKQKLVLLSLIFCLFACSNQTFSSTLNSSFSTSSSESTSINGSSVSSSVNDSSESSSIIDSSQIEEEEDEIVIMSINDLHGKIEKGISYGLSNVYEKIKNVRQEHPYNILIANGDMFQGQAISNLVYGESVVSIMNNMDFDMMGIGNHEFDWGIEKVLNYFDGELSNGEAEFPLVNSNIKVKSTNSLLTNENTLPYTIIERANYKIGLISGIGPSQRGSILAPRVSDYSFENLATSLGNLSSSLRQEEGCDLIIASIHDGGENTVYTDINSSLAALSGDKRIDALINGHTHQAYYGSIERNNLPPLQVVQAGSNAEGIGYISLKISPSQKAVTSSSSEVIYCDDEYDEYIEGLVNGEHQKLESQLSAVYGVAGEDISYRNQLFNWSISCMQKATDSDIAISNTGGIRQAYLEKGQNIMVSDLYAINPFDNEILLTPMSGLRLKNYINQYGSSCYFTIKDGSSIDSLDDNKEYNVAVIDYLGFKSYFPLSSSYRNTGLIFRELMRDDIILRNELNQEFCPISNPTSLLSKLI